MESVPRSLENCPRCGVRLEQTYKYCPHCAYRLRPELGQEPRRVAPTRSGAGARLIALGGYLAFSSLLLLVVLAGFRLFAEPEVTPVTSSEFQRARDLDPLPLTRESFRPVSTPGVGYWGAWSWEEESEDISTFRVDDPFEIGIHEVTNDQYYVFLLERARRSGVNTPRRLLPSGWSQPSGHEAVPVMYESRTGDQPVLGVPFSAAIEFCAWFWETRLGSPPDLLVDLPTPLEYVWAARGENYEFNFPWGAELRNNTKVNLDGRPLDVDDEEVGEYHGVFALVGNAAEWAHGSSVGDFEEPLHVPTAAGWSFENSEYRGSFREPISPFTWRGFQVRDAGEARRDLGFRLVLRPTRSLPEFVPVQPGPVTYGTPSRTLLPPSEMGGLAAVIRFEAEQARVSSAFEIGRTEVSNRQYLLFLVETAERTTGAALEELFPASWTRERETADVVYGGGYGPPEKITRLFLGGRENHPVEGVSPAQAEAYARWLSGRLRRHARLPTVEEYLRAARGAEARPYPWGTDRDTPLLVCSGRADDEGRAVSLLGRFGSDGARLYGLAGNLPELVWDAAGRRHLLAGGCYMFPPSSCTLDTFMDPTWKTVEYVVSSYDDDVAPLPLDEDDSAAPFEVPPGARFTVNAPLQFAGFRLVLVRERP